MPGPDGTAPDQRLSDVELLARAWRVAAERHVDHRRKGSRAEPYVNHLAEVADLVATATGGSDARLVAAAVLHDTIEDTGMSLAELDRLFGPMSRGWWRRSATTRT